MSWYIRSFFGFTFLYILYFFKYSCTNIFHRRSLYTFYFYKHILYTGILAEDQKFVKKLSGRKFSFDPSENTQLVTAIKHHHKAFLYQHLWHFVYNSSNEHAVLFCSYHMQKRKCLHIDDIFVTVCTGGSKIWSVKPVKKDFNQSDCISFSVLIIFMEFVQDSSKILH